VTRAPDQKCACRHTRKRGQVRPRHGTRLEDEESEDEDRQRRVERGALAARQEREDERGRKQRRLRDLDPRAAGRLPRNIGAEIEEPWCVGLGI
jgi:hypothetical protein